MPFAIVRNDVVLKADSDVAGPPEVSVLRLLARRCDLLTSC